MLGWVLQQQGLDPDKFPDNRMGHVGKEQQPPIADEIIKRCEELGMSKIVGIEDNSNQR